MVGGSIYGGKMDFCWLYGPEITDRMDIWAEKAKNKYSELKIQWLPHNKNIERMVMLL